jgi:hypothetical protein
MKPFEIEPDMLTMQGVFYPTGYMFMMFPTEQEARHAEQLLKEDGQVDEDTISLLTPQDIQGKITRTIGSADTPMPSAGTEADTVRRFAELASQGHHALMVHAPKHAQSDHIMELLKDLPMSYGQKYRQLVIEDLA